MKNDLELTISSIKIQSFKDIYKMNIAFDKGTILNNLINLGWCVVDDTLLQISKLDFCIQDVTLFLDTHPDDQEAKKYYKEGMKHLLKMKETYLKNGGALTNRDGKNIENYINEPFPWIERRINMWLYEKRLQYPVNVRKPDS